MTEAFRIDLVITSSSSWSVEKPWVGLLTVFYVDVIEVLL